MEKRLFTSECVTNGHPDKVADSISDAILDACLAQDPGSRVACEAMVTTDFCLICGEITTKAKVDYDAVAREAIRRELDAAVFQIQRPGKGQGHGGFSHTGDILQKNVSPGKDSGQSPQKGLILPDNDLPDLVQNLLYAGNDFTFTRGHGMASSFERC